MARWDRYDRYDRYDFWPRYVPVAERRAKAARELPRLLKKGEKPSPVVIEGRKIAVSFWGASWCDNLERYSDFSNRLPRGRTYVRNGSVVDLRIEKGTVKAFVSGSELYRIEVKIAPVPKTQWSAICKDCSGAIDSLVELLQGRFSQGVMARICREKTGLLPSPSEIEFTCSCPDAASMCKHVAAVLYGIGARLDSSPELLFHLRAVDHLALIAQAGNEVPRGKAVPASKKVLSGEDLAGIFGIEIAEESEEVQNVTAVKTVTKKRAPAVKRARKGKRSKAKA